MSGALEKLKAFEDAVLGEAKYVDRFDALSLATVLSDEELSAGSPSDLYDLPAMRGLSLLTADLAALLTEAFIDEQNAAALMSEELRQCERHLHSTSKEDTLAVADASDSGVSKRRPPRTPSFQLALKRALAISSRSEHGEVAHKVSDIARRHVLSRLGRAFEEGARVMDAKVYAYEAVNNILRGYTKFTSAIAKEARLSHVDERLSIVTRPCLESLLSHKFLDCAHLHALQTRIASEHASVTFGDDSKMSVHSLYSHRGSSVAAPEAYSTASLKMGAGAVLVLWSFSECFNNEQIGHKIWDDPTFAIFMCFGDLLLLLWMWGASIHVWRLHGIDYTRLLGLEGTELERERLPERLVYSAATDLSLLFLAIFILFNKVRRGVFQLPGSLAAAHALPACMVVYFVYRMISPPASRKVWHRMLWTVLLAPLYPVSFRDGYVGDLLTSLVRVLLPLCFSVAYLVMSGYAWLSNSLSLAASESDRWWQDSAFFRLFLVPFVTLFPLWLRLLQCLRRSVETGKRWPHMVNGLKYTSAIAVISIGTFDNGMRRNPYWLLAFVCATLFQYTWDLTMDWGLVVDAGSRGASPISCCGLALRQTRLLGPPWLYLLIMASNLLLRFAWTATLLPVDTSTPRTPLAVVLSHIGPIAAAAEILRRMVWGFLRLEHEQLQVAGTPAQKEIEMQSMEPMVVGTAAGGEQGSWWAGVPAALVVVLERRVALEVKTPVTKARLVEAVFFGGAVFLFVAVLGYLSEYS